MLLSNRDKTAITYKGTKYSYNQVLIYSQDYADYFASTGKPQKVLICGQNSPEWCFAFHIGGVGNIDQSNHVNLIHDLITRLITLLLKDTSAFPFCQEVKVVFFEN